ncbi:MAG: S-adenosylmethionine decarboxylase, partial [bacterium]
TKVLSFNLYDFCITLSDKEREEYIHWIHEQYNAEKIAKVSEKICEVIKANILSVSKQDYDPVGASTMVLMSDYMGGKWEEEFGNSHTQVKMHLDKSHITAHTYPEAADPNGICSFRVDIDIATCGEISPLTAVNALFESFECDLVYIDYVVRGFTRLEDGSKIYNDSYFNSIQDFIKPEILENYEYRLDLNIPNDNIWQTKLMIKDFPAERYLLYPEEKDHPYVPGKMELLKEEMGEIFRLR